MDKYINFYFESSSTLTPEFAAFARDYKKHVKQVFAGVGLELIKFNRGHFECSGFAKNNATGKLVYFSTSDVRGNDGWLTNSLIRTATDDRDYRGGNNNWTSLPMLGTKALTLTES